MPRVEDKKNNVYKGPWTEEEDTILRGLLAASAGLPKNKLMNSLKSTHTFLVFSYETSPYERVASTVVHKRAIL